MIIFFMITCHFFDYHNFNDEFSIRPFKASMEGLIEQIDEALYQLGTMGPDIKDAKIQQYQSKIEYALEDIRALVANYVELKNGYNHYSQSNYSV